MIKLNNITNSWQWVSDFNGKIGLSVEEIASLNELIGLKCRHVCLSWTDFTQYTAAPSYNKNFYACQSGAAKRAGKQGFFNNGQTMIWASYSIDSGLARISFGMPKSSISSDPAWSEAMSFRTPEDVLKIYKMMKMKAFW